MKNFNILGGKGKGEGKEPPKKGGAVPPSAPPSVSQPSSKAPSPPSEGIAARAKAKARGKKPRKPMAPKEKKPREQKPTEAKAGKKLSPLMIAGIAALVVIAAGLFYMMRKPPQQQPPAQPVVSEAQKARLAMGGEKKEESPLKAARPAAPVEKAEPPKAEKPEPAPPPKVERIAGPKPSAAPIAEGKRKDETAKKAKEPVAKEPPAKKPAAKPAAPEPKKPKVLVRSKKRIEKSRESVPVGPLGPTEPGYLPPEPDSPVDEEFRRQTIFYLVLVEESDSREELRQIAKSLELTTVAPEIREKSYGDRDVYWLTVGHYTRESDAYNMAQVIRRMGYIAEVVTEKVYH